MLGEKYFYVYEQEHVNEQPRFETNWRLLKYRHKNKWQILNEGLCLLFFLFWRTKNVLSLHTFATNLY